MLCTLQLTVRPFCCAQMLVDCSYGSGYDGCQGGWPTAAWDFIRANGGLPSESLRSYVRCAAL